MTTNVVNLPDSFEREFHAMWDAQLLDYPTITRNEAGEWNYFDVTPERDPWGQGERLARESLRVAAQIREADGCALMHVVEAAAAIDLASYKAVKHPVISLVARSFICEIIDEAVRGYTGLPRLDVA